MKTPRLMTCARALSFGLAIGAASLMVVPADTAPVYAQADVAQQARQAVASYKRRNYRDAVAQFEQILAPGLDVEAAKKVRAEVSDVLAKEFSENNLADVTLRGRLRGVGKWLLAGRTSSDGVTVSDSGKVKNDPDGVARFVKEYFTESNLVIRVERGKAIAKKYGEYAVPFIVENYLGSDKVDERALSRTLLATIGSEAVLPLNQVLKSTSAAKREYAAHSLGDIGDSRSVPMLSQIATVDESAAVKAAASSALTRIGAEVDGAPVQAAMFGYYWWLQAHGYYTNASSGGYGPGSMPMIGADVPGSLPLLVDDASRTRTVWRWRADKLEAEEIPLWNYADTLAEEAALSCVRSTLNPDAAQWFPVASALYARIAVKQYNANQSRLASGAEGAVAQVVSQLGENGISRLSHLKGLAGAAGPQILLMAIQDSLGEGYADVTAGLCDLFLDLDTCKIPGAMIEVPVESGAPPESEGGSGETPAETPAREAPAGETPAGETPAEEEAPVVTIPLDPFGALTECLNSPSRQVRYAAARALAIVARGHGFPSINLATTQMAASLEETDIKTVALIAENTAVRTNYLNALTGLGYSVRVYEKLDEGVHHVRNSATIDAILIESDLARRVMSYWEPSEAGAKAGAASREENAAKLLRDDVRTKNIPLLLVTPDGTEEELKSTFAPMMQDENFSENSILSYGPNVNIETTALSEIIDMFINRNSAAREMSTNGMVTQTARALLKLDPNNTHGDLNLVVKKLGSSIAATAGRTPEAKVAAAGAIAHLAAYKGLDATAGADVVATLAGILNGSNPVDTPAVRAAVANALGSLFRNHPSLYVTNGDAYTGLLATMRLQAGAGEPTDSVVAARNNAGVALGSAPLSDAERFAVLEAGMAGSIPLTAAPAAE